MVSTRFKPFFHNEDGVSVVFGTLLLILITIMVASSIAYMVSSTQEEMMERQSHLSNVENEKLKILSTNPSGNSTHWESIDFTVVNLNIRNSYIKGLSLNERYTKNYMIKDGTGNLISSNGYPEIYSYNDRVKVPAEGSKKICLNLSGISIHKTETFDLDGWSDYDKNYTYSLSKHPLTAYSDVDYSVEVYDKDYTYTEYDDYTMDYESGDITIIKSGNMAPLHNETIDTSGWNDNINRTYSLNYPPIKPNEEVFNSTNNLKIIPSNNYTMDYGNGNITLLGNDYGGNMTNNSNYYIKYMKNNTKYNITYTVNFDTFTPPYPVTKAEPLKLGIMTSLTNHFEQSFSPPVPLANVQFKTEHLIGPNGSESYNNYLVLDASESFDSDGSITGYKWAVWNNSSEVIYDYNLTGLMARPTKLNLSEAKNVKIDLKVIDNNGMESKLSQRSGNLTIR